MENLTQPLLDALDQEEHPLRLCDPRSSREYVLLPADEFDAMIRLVHDKLGIQDAYPLMDEVARREGWDDPEMDIYNDFTPQQP